MAIEVADVVVGTNPADPSGQTIRFTVNSAVSGVTWRFGDCSDTDDLDPAVPLDHTYTGQKRYHAICHVRRTGQRIIVPVDVGAPPVPVLTRVIPAVFAAGSDATEITVLGTNFRDDAVVRANGAPQATVHVGLSELSFNAQIDVPTVIAITVANGVAVSNAVNLTAI